MLLLYQLCADEGKSLHEGTFGGNNGRELS